MKRLLIMSFGWLMTGVVLAENWLETGKSNDNLLQFFIDLDTVQGVKGYPYISAVVQQTYLKGHVVRKKGLYYSKQQWYISCDDNSYFRKAYIDYGMKNEVLHSWQYQFTVSKNDLKYAFPNTMADGVVKSVCNYYKTGSIYYQQKTKNTSFLPVPYCKELYPNVLNDNRYLECVLKQYEK